MLDAKLADLLEGLSESEYVPSQALAGHCGISDRTVRTRVQELREELERNGATIESRQRYGYCLVVQDRQKYQIWLKDEHARMQEAVPNTVEDRFHYLLALFLRDENYHKIETLSETLWVSTKTLSNELRQVEFALGHYNLTIERKPHYGMRVTGSEFDKRKCCMDYLIQSCYAEERAKTKLTPRIGEVLLDVILRQRIKFSEAAFQNIVSYLYIACLRGREGNVIRQAPENQQLRVRNTQEYSVAQTLVQKLREVEVEIADTQAEMMYIAVFIAGRRILGDESKLQANPVVMKAVNELSALLLDCIQRVYNLNFRENLNVRIALYNHLATFHIRMMYGIPMPNPILDEVKQNYPFAFAIAQRAMVELEQFYQRKIPEDETGYFAIILEMALESLKENIEKKNILLVCMTGKSSSRFLAFRFRNEFEVYINRLDAVCMNLNSTTCTTPTMYSRRCRCTPRPRSLFTRSATFWMRAISSKCAESWNKAAWTFSVGITGRNCSSPISRPGPGRKRCARSVARWRRSTPCRRKSSALRYWPGSRWAAPILATTWPSHTRRSAS